MNKEKIILVGGGGHCKSVIDVIEAEGKFEIAGIIDTKEKIGTDVSSYKVIGSDDDLEQLSKKYINFFVSLGYIKSNTSRIRIFNSLQSLGVTLPTIISPRAYISHNAIIGKGTIVMHDAFVNSGANIGEACILNTGCIIEHDVTIGNHSHISTGAIVNGNCIININCFIGSNAVINNGIETAPGTLVASGSVITEKTKPNSLYAGNPAVFKKNLDA